mmetsp:Transcript_15217/g.35854  ORF Transcript_15217/g.35854 Transcript_15217/m.35854 type:complete len:352 (+) Transcript_15217:84-1139(+)
MPIIRLSFPQWHLLIVVALAHLATAVAHPQSRHGVSLRFIEGSTLFYDAINLGELPSGFQAMLYVNGILIGQQSNLDARGQFDVQPALVAGDNLANVLVVDQNERLLGMGLLTFVASVEKVHCTPGIGNVEVQVSEHSVSWRAKFDLPEGFIASLAINDVPSARQSNFHSRGMFVLTASVKQGRNSARVDISDPQGERLATGSVEFDVTLLPDLDILAAQPGDDWDAPKASRDDDNIEQTVPHVRVQVTLSGDGSRLVSYDAVNLELPPGFKTLLYVNQSFVAEQTNFEAAGVFALPPLASGEHLINVVVVDMDSGVLGTGSHQYTVDTQEDIRVKHPVNGRLDDAQKWNG